MYNNLKCLGIIPARGGSKGIKHKNIVDLGGKPLLQYTAEAAHKSRHLDRIILSTDDEDIAKVGRECGLEVPFMRPPYLSGDNVANPPVVYHVLSKLEAEGFIPDIIVLLQPTSPFRTCGHIDDSIMQLVNRNCSSVLGVMEIPAHYSPHWQFKRDEENRISLFTTGGTPKARVHQRQKLPVTYVSNGALYVFWLNTLLSDNSYYGDTCECYEMSHEDSVNIDSKEDLRLAEIYLQERMAKQ